MTTTMLVSLLVMILIYRIQCTETDDRLSALEINEQRLTSSIVTIQQKLLTWNQQHQCVKPVSCLDIYFEDRRNPSGEYIIYQREHAVKVYCSFEGDYGFTYISRKSAEASIDVTALYSTNNFAKIRIFKNTGEQREVLVENMLSFQNLSNLHFALNSHDGYKGPSPDSGLQPYLFLGFLPIKLSENRNSQRYRAKDMDFTFVNCDGNPNSYITFFFNPKHASPGSLGSANDFMTHWITSSTAIDYPQYMDSSFYMDWEMHMGGCGGFLTSNVLNIKAALGLPFAIPKV
ncbi:uncharacterized protein [Mytilus edulis]|uniref:uncharacterized protein n=1 Tax=Mytilus edulis TaxID=6550 RepID=UPI0039EE1614